MTSSIEARPRAAVLARQRAQDGRALFAAAVGGIGFLLTVVAFYPGFVTGDAMDQFRQGLSGHYTDWHPPIMALVWSGLDRIVVGPQPMLLLQAGGYWLAAALLLAALPVTLSRVGWWAVVAALFSPAILSSLGVVGKDGQLTACWLIAAAWALTRYAKGTRPHWMEMAAMLVLVSYGALLRQNSALIAGPLLLYVLSGRAHIGRIWTTLGFYIGVAILYCVLASGLVAFLGAEHSHVLRSLLNFDLAGITVRTGASAFPFPLDAAELQRLGPCYEGGTWHNNLVWGDCSFVWQRGVATPLSEGSYIHAWLVAILHHPVAYATHRIVYFLRFCGLMTLQPTRGFWMDGTPPNDLGFVTDHHALFYGLKYYVYAGLATPFFRIAFWLAAAGILARYAHQIAGGEAAARFAAMTGVVSGLYILTYLPFGVAPDFRYVHVAIALTTFGFAVLAPGIQRAVRHSRWLARLPWRVREVTVR